MSARPWYRRYGADFIAGTLTLSLEEKGAYSIILDLIYDRGGPIPDEPRYIAGVCGCSLRKWTAIRDRLIKAGKIAVCDGQIMNERAQKEIEISSKTAEKLAENGSKGGRKRAENKTGRNENNDLPEAGLKHRAHKPYPEPDITSEETSSSEGAETATPPWDELGDDPNKRLFSDRVLAFVAERSAAKAPQKARALIGRWKRDCRDDAGMLLDLLKQARAQNIADLPAWMTKAIKARQEPRQRPAWRQGMAVISEPGKPDAFGRRPDHPLYGSSAAA